MTKKLIVLFDECGTPTFNQDRENEVFAGVAILYPKSEEESIFNAFRQPLKFSRKEPQKTRRITGERANEIANLASEKLMTIIFNMKLLEVIAAKYIEEYKVFLKFNEGFETVVDLKDTIFNDKRKIFLVLRDKKYFKDFSLKLNTICWKNEADFAPEFLRSLQPVKESITNR